MKIRDCNIIITGAASGFGKAMALHFAGQGAVVNALDVNCHGLQKLKCIRGIHTYQCDVSNNTEVEKITDQIFNLSNEVNVLINNAGIMENSPLVNPLNRPDNRHPIDLWTKVVQVNQNSIFYMARSVVSKMIKNRKKGIIINISSIAAQGNAGQTAYSATKAAAEAMSKVWAKELGAAGIRSVAIAPGFMNTSGTHDALEEKALEAWVQKTPLKRTGEISEVVSAAQFAIENDFFNGEILNINGGLSI